MNRALAVAVCSWATDKDDAAMLLDMLGVWPVGPTYLGPLSTTKPRAASDQARKAKARIDAAKPAEIPLAAARKPYQRSIVPEHGTNTGYRRHLNSHEPPCDPCRIAGALHRKLHAK